MTFIEPQFPMVLNGSGLAAPGKKTQIRKLVGTEINDSLNYVTFL